MRCSSASVAGRRRTGRDHRIARCGDDTKVPGVERGGIDTDREGDRHAVLAADPRFAGEQSEPRQLIESVVRCEDVSARCADRRASGTDMRLQPTSSEQINTRAVIDAVTPALSMSAIISTVNTLEVDPPPAMRHEA